MTLESLLESIEPLSKSAMEAAKTRQDALAKPPESLGRLEELSIQLAGITGTLHNTMDKTHLLVFAADNGVVEEGVSSAPQSVTLMQTINLTRAKTGASVLAKHFGAGITVCDVGVNAQITEPKVLNRKIAFGTQNIAKGPAMTREQAEKAILIGAELAMQTEANAMGVGEMGIGNTTTSSAVLSVLLGADVETVTGRGGGITDGAFLKKKQVIAQAIALNRPDPKDPVDVLCKVGGFDLAAMCGAFLGGAASHRPMVIDGFISVVAALCAVRLCPTVRDYLRTECPVPVSLCDVSMDNIAFIHKGVNYLEERGYRDIAVFAYHLDRPNNFDEGISTCHSKLPLRRFDAVDANHNEGYRLMRELCGSRSGLPDALLIANDRLFIGAWYFLLEKGIRVPEELAVLTHANRGRLPMSHIPLTRLEVDPLALTREVFREIAGKITGDAYTARPVTPELIVGRSCGEAE